MAHLFDKWSDDQLWLVIWFYMEEHLKRVFFFKSAGLLLVFESLDFGGLFVVICTICSCLLLFLTVLWEGILLTIYIHGLMPILFGCMEWVPARNQS